MTPGPLDGRGSAPERTALAWRRTGLSLLVLTATLAKVSADEGRVGALLWLAAGVPGSVAVLVASTLTYRARRGGAGAGVGLRVVDPWWQVLAASVTAVLLGVLCLAHVLGGVPG